MEIAVRWLQLNHPEEPVGLPKVLVQATSKARVTEAAKATTGEVRDRADNQHVQFAPAPAKERAAAAGASLRTQRKLDSLARKAPSLFAQVQAGEMSTHKACVEAGIVKTPSPFAQVQRLWSKLTDDEKDAIRRMP